MSHIGLGNNALLTAKSLKTLGADCRVVGVNTAADIDTHLKSLSAVTKTVAPVTTATHALVEASFFGLQDASNLAESHPSVEFVYRNHSQIGFLQVEPGAITNFRDIGRLQEKTLNVRLSANSERFVTWWQNTYNQRCLFLPNLYPQIDRTRSKLRTAHSRDTLRFGIFGSMRLLKNFTSAAAGALLAARNLGRDCQLTINGGRNENGGKVVIDAIKAMTNNLPWASIAEVNWQDWTDFRHTIGSMDVALQPSFTETFNIVTADAIAEGVPSVVSDAIEWCPPHWSANVDDPNDIARVAQSLVLNPHAAQDGLDALNKYQADSLAVWKKYLGV